MTTETVENGFHGDPILPNKTHPVVWVLKKYNAQVKKMGEELGKGSISSAKALEVSRNYLEDLPDDLGSLGKFGVFPSDLLGIWEQVGVTFAGFDSQERIRILYHLGRLIINCHGAAGSEELGNLPGYYFTHGTFPDGTRQNQAGLVRYGEGLKDIRKSLGILRKEKMTPLIDQTTDILGNSLTLLGLSLGISLSND